MGIASFSNTPPEFDHYTISRVLGEGGMGRVYLANDRRTGLPVAIKVMSGWASDPELQARFLKESRILSALSHRNIVRCYEITESRDGILSIVMGYVDGVDFHAFEGRPFPELLPLMIQALMGLTYLRSQNILHRDLSSNNIFVTLENEKRVTKILDFGVATILQQGALDGDVKTQVGQFLGKLAFASPEHFLQANIDWRSDVYSLGVIFHRLLTRKPPITVARESNYFDWLVAHQKVHRFEVEAPADVPPLPEALRDVVRRMLARSPDDRPQSYEEILDALDRVQRSLPPTLEPDPLAVEAESPASVEASQQKRWPDLKAPESHTERFVPLPSPPSPAIPASPSPASLDATKTAPTVVFERSERLPDISMWTGGAAKDSQPEPVSSSSDLLEDKTERLDDVIEKLRQQAMLEPLPPLKLPSTPEPLSSAPPPQHERRPEPAPAVPRATEHPPVASPKPGQRLVIYGEPPPAVMAPLPAVPRVVAPAASAPAPAPDATGRRIRGIGIGLIVAAIVVLFAAVLWVLISLLRGASAGDTRRSSHAGLTGAVAAAALRSVRPKPE